MLEYNNILNEKKIFNLKEINEFLEEEVNEFLEVFAGCANTLLFFLYSCANKLIILFAKSKLFLLQ